MLLAMAPSSPGPVEPHADLTARLAFLLEADRLKGVERRNDLIDGSRRENTAEHSWHLALFAVVLSGYANEPIDVLRVVTMVVLHDLVEIDAGDTFAYDVAGHEDKAEREQAAADRLYGLLPAGQAAELRAVWDEFEAGETPEARFAMALDRLQPVLLNHARGGGPWEEYGITAEKVLARNRVIADGADALWHEARRRVHELVDAGLLR
jgi:putative hydrolase of HD superfamily